MIGSNSWTSFHVSSQSLSDNSILEWGSIRMSFNDHFYRVMFLKFSYAAWKNSSCSLWTQTPRLHPIPTWVIRGVWLWNPRCFVKNKLILSPDKAKSFSSCVSLLSKGASSINLVGNNWLAEWQDKDQASKDGFVFQLDNSVETFSDKLILWLFRKMTSKRQC